MSCPVPHFIDAAEVEQAKELRAYLKTKDADIEDEPNEDFVTDVKQLVEQCSVCWQGDDASETDIEAVMNSLISLMILVPEPEVEMLVHAFCEQVGGADEKSSCNEVRLHVLNNLFNGFVERSQYRYVVYSAMVKFAGHSRLIQRIPAELKEVKRLIALWDLPKPKIQDLLRNLHDAYIECNQRDSATKVMIELLSTYTESTAAQAKDDAQRCIVTSLADPSTFLLDHLLNLKPVNMLEGELIHDLLTIFITGKLSDYNAFYEKHKTFVDGLGLNHQENVRKMRLLTFMYLSEGRNDIDFSTIEKEIGITENEVEQFVIDAVKTKTVMAKMDHCNQKVLINSATHRTFTKSQWVDLKSELESWQNNLQKVSAGFKLLLDQAEN